MLILVHRIPLARVGSWKSLNCCLRNSWDTRIILGSTRKLVQAGSISVASHRHARHLALISTATYGLNDSSSGLAARIVEKSRAWSDCGGDIESRFTQDELLIHKKPGNDQRRLVRGSDNQQFRLPRMRRMIGGCPFAVGFECEPELYRKEHPFRRTQARS